MTENLGRRIAAHRQKLGWTQQDLSERLGISRVAVSHLESGVSVPGERTVALLAGVFKLEPHELVAGTGYPTAKAERLPVVTARYTEVEHQVAMLDAELRWAEQVGGALARDALSAWRHRLVLLTEQAHDRRERELVDDAGVRLRAVLDQLLGGTGRR